MTYNDLNGQELEHPEYGRLTIIEHNHADKVFCYTASGRYLILPLKEIEEYFVEEEDEEFMEAMVEFIDFSEALISDPKKKCIIIEVREDGVVDAKVKNVRPEEVKIAIGLLYDNLCEPHEGRYIAN